MTGVTVGQAEQIEIRSYVDFATGGPSEPLGIRSIRAGGVHGLAIRADASNFFNRAGGFGVDEPVTVDIVAGMCEFFREQGVPMGAILVAPDLLPPDWPEIVGKLNLTEGARLVKLGLDLDTMSTVDDLGLDAGLRVERVDPAQAQEWASVMLTVFGMTPLIDMAAACVGRPDWQQYAVWEGDSIVAVGSVYFAGDGAAVFGGATAPQARGRGAQSALLRVRVQAAQAAGCRWMVGDTGAERPGEHNSSLHNMLRLGFRPLYERVGWRWQAGS